MVIAAVVVPQGRRHKLARHIDEERLRSAIVAAEAGTTGKIHVTLSHGFSGSTFDHARQVFKRLRLERSPDRNYVLFFVVPSRREFAVVGDTGIYQKVGQEFWDRVVAAVAEKTKTADLTSGLVHGIEEAGRELRAHFPSESVS